MSKSHTINGELIKSSGKKLQMVGYLMIGGIVHGVIYYALVQNSTDIEFIQNVVLISSIITLVITHIIIAIIIRSGADLINSTQIIDEFITIDDSKTNMNNMFINGDVHEMYYENGQLCSKGSYKDDKRDGFWVEYSISGELMKVGEYKSGIMNGKWEYFNRGGKMDKAMSGYYENGVRIRGL
jgi:hypothetical protein